MKPAHAIFIISFQEWLFAIVQKLQLGRSVRLLFSDNGKIFGNGIACFFVLGAENAQSST